MTGLLRPGVAAAAAVAVLAAPAAAFGQARAQGTVLMSESEQGRAGQEEWGYSDAVIAGDMIYLSGVVVGLRPGETGPEAAYERVYARIARTLERAGASWADVVDMTSYHTDVDGQIDAMAAVHKRHLSAPWPAWTAIGVARILGNGITEIKITARRPDAAGRAGRHLTDPATDPS